MRVLFVLGNVYPHDDANSMIVMRICRELKRIDSRMQISILGTSEEEGSEILNDIQIHRFVISQLNGVSHDLRDFLTQNIAISRKQKIVRLLSNPKLFVEYIQNRIKVNSPSIQYRNVIRSLHHDNNYDVVIGVSFPFTACLGAARTGLNIPFFYYQLDPYFSHYLQPNKRMSLNQERYVCRKANAIMLTDLIYIEYLKSPLKKYLKKSIVVGFPAIEKNVVSEYKSTSTNYNMINLAFIGTMYEDIRSPEYFFSLIKKLVQRGNRIHIDLVGPLVGHVNIPNQPEWLTYHGRLNAEDAKFFMQKADILVNIGNSIINQMPSKIFEYFSSGKPIINICKTDQCPTLPYTKKYPNCISVIESDDIDESLCEHLELFIKQSRAKRIPYEKVVDLFPENTTSQVATMFLQAMQNR